MTFIFAAEYWHSMHLYPNTYPDHQCINVEDSSLVEQLRTIMQDITLQMYEAILTLCGSNLHHPLWNPVGYTKQEPQANALIDIMTAANIRNLLLLGTVTFPQLMNQEALQ